MTKIFRGFGVRNKDKSCLNKIKLISGIFDMYTED